MAMRDITELMNTYRECSRNLWNVYFSKRKDIGDTLDVYEHIRELLFDSLILSELSFKGEAEGEDIPAPLLRVIPGSSSLILIQRLSESGEPGYWDQEKDMAVGPDDIKLAFVDYFDFSHVPMKEFITSSAKFLASPTIPNMKGERRSYRRPTPRCFTRRMRTSGRLAA